MTKASVLAFYCFFICRLFVSSTSSEKSRHEIFKHRKLQVATQGGIPGSYLVAFHKSSALVVGNNATIEGDAQRSMSPLVRALRGRVQAWKNMLKKRSSGGNANETAIEQVYQFVWPGVALSSVSKDLLQVILQDEDVAWVEQDQVVSIDQVTVLNNTQITSVWGLDRIDQRNLPLNSAYNYKYTGAGVNIYIIDTGIFLSHLDFRSGKWALGRIRASCGKDLVNNGVSDNCFDYAGHGTHVAAIAAGRFHGVAKSANIISVQTFGPDGAGDGSVILAGMDYVLSQRQAFPTKPIVVNMSFSVKHSNYFTFGTQAMVDARVVTVAAAGNNVDDACLYTPGSNPNVITVGATTMQDVLANFSNRGSCVDVLAPGDTVRSAWPTSPYATQILSGTSMSSPHVAGVAALYLEANPSWTPAQVWEAIYADATPGVIKSVPSGTVNRLVYTGLLL